MLPSRSRNPSPNRHVRRNGASSRFRPPEKRRAPPAAAAFAQLAAIQREKRRADEFPMGLEARTLEDLVRGLLRPMLQGWLDQKLPELLERLVKAELTKALHDAGLE